MTSAADLLSSDFATLPDLIRAHAAERSGKTAVADDHRSVTYAELDRLMDRVAAGLQRDRVPRGAAMAMVCQPSVEQAVVFLGALRAGCAATPIQPSATPDQIADMVRDSGAPIIFLDAPNAAMLDGREIAARRVLIEELEAWLPPEDAESEPVAIRPEDGFNIIYSSGTTGTPKGIVQSHAMRWAHIARNTALGFGEAVAMIATPLYSNTTLVTFLPTLGNGGTAVVMSKFDARRYLELAERHRATHTMLVPVQYQRIMALPDFDRFDLSSFRVKTCTSAPFKPELKADVLRRWPGLLIEYYGMTEGGASCGLNCNEHPDKLHTVGRPLPGHEIKLIDEQDREAAPGDAGEVVGRSPTMMTGYHGRDRATRDAEWYDAEGNRWIRHGDVARFDEDGFLILMDRKKDLIISGGYNIYPSDLEAVLSSHPDVAECAVIGFPNEQWGESPVGVFVPRHPQVRTADVLSWTNERLGKTQRLAGLHPMQELPRSAIGKVLKRELRDRVLGAVA